MIRTINFFKETMGNIETAKDFLTNYLPESVMRVVNLDTLEPQKDSFISLDLEENFSDLLFQVDVSGKEGYLYFLMVGLKKVGCLIGRLQLWDNLLVL